MWQPSIKKMGKKKTIITYLSLKAYLLLFPLLGGKDIRFFLERKTEEENYSDLNHEVKTGRLYDFQCI